MGKFVSVVAHRYGLALRCRLVRVANLLKRAPTPNNFRFVLFIEARQFASLALVLDGSGVPSYLIWHAGIKAVFFSFLLPTIMCAGVFVKQDTVALRRGSALLRSLPPMKL